MSVRKPGYYGAKSGGKRHGKGTFVFKSGDRHEGFFKVGKKHGKGTHFFKSGAKYIGEWTDDFKEGEFRFFKPGSSEYVIHQFKANKRIKSEEKAPVAKPKARMQKAPTSSTADSGGKAPAAQPRPSTDQQQPERQTPDPAQTTVATAQGKKGKVISSREEMLENMMREMKESHRLALEIERQKVKSLVNENLKVLDSVLDSVGKRCRIPHNKLKIQRKVKLGKGGFGSVLSGEWENENGVRKKVAVKAIAYGLQTDAGDVFKEFSRSLQFRHKNVIETFGFDDSRRNEIAIVMEKMDGNLHEYVLENVLSLVEKFNLIVMMTEGIHYLHKMEPKPFIHRDIKGPNFLHRRRRGEEVEVKVCDFGLAKAVVDQSRETQVSAAGQGSKLWMAPESGKGLYSVKSDIYSLGITFWEILFEQYPYEGFDPNHIFYKVDVEGLRPNLNLYDNNNNKKTTEGGGEEDEGEEEEDDEDDDDTPKDGVLPQILKDLLLMCWNGDRTKRPTSQELVVWLDDNEMEVLAFGQDYYFPPKGVQLEVQEKRKKLVHFQMNEEVKEVEEDINQIKEVTTANDDDDLSSSSSKKREGIEGDYNWKGKLLTIQKKFVFYGGRRIEFEKKASNICTIMLQDQGNFFLFWDTEDEILGISPVIGGEHYYIQQVERHGTGDDPSGMYRWENHILLIKKKFAFFKEKGYEFTEYASNAVCRNVYSVYMKQEGSRYIFTWDLEDNKLLGVVEVNKEIEFVGRVQEVQENEKEKESVIIREEIMGDYIWEGKVLTIQKKFAYFGGRRIDYEKKAPNICTIVLPDIKGKFFLVWDTEDEMLVLFPVVQNGEHRFIQRISRRGTGKDLISGKYIWEDHILSIEKKFAFYQERRYKLDEYASNAFEVKMKGGSRYLFTWDLEDNKMLGIVEVNKEIEFLERVNLKFEHSGTIQSDTILV